MEQICRALQPDEITSVYEVWGSSHFPEDELKPLSSIKALLEQKQYSGYGLFSQERETEEEEGESLLGYAFFCLKKKKRKCFLITMPFWRSTGIKDTAVFFCRI